MKICMVSEHNCIRVSKESHVLQKAGHEVILATRDLSLRFVENFTHVAVWHDLKSFDSLINHYKNTTDIFHLHNEPTWHATRIRELIPDAIIIQDFHDMQYWRMGDKNHVRRTGEEISWFDEDLAIESSDAFIVTSPECKRALREKTDKPIVFVPSAVPLDWYYSGLRHFRGGLVSQGGHAIPQENDKLLNTWRDYTELYTALIDKIDIFAYAPNFSFVADDILTNHYENIGVECGMAHPTELLKLISGHTWNLVGNWQTEPSPVWKWALPNKFFDAVAAGTPSAVFNCPMAAKIVRKYDIGIVCQRPYDLIKQWELHKEKRANLMKVRRQLSIDHYVPEIEKLYKAMIKIG